jgi:hypothetical protein
MMSYALAIYAAVLFVVLTPGVLLRLPPKGSLLTQAAVHGLVFALVFCLTSSYVSRLTSGFEDMAGKACMTDAECMNATMMCKNRMCTSKAPDM